MRVTKTTAKAMRGALEAVNLKYGGNIAFRFLEPTNTAGTSYKFRLTVWDSRRKGARRSAEGRRIASAC